jgi:molybdopterin-containing oxidoreductase family iron-sulfur binding subunit
MGASLALAGVTGCTRQPRETIVPYVKQPEELVLGKPMFFATAATLRGYAQGILVESHEGRPTKIEGNPDHPASLGATDVFGQAWVLDLYDPDRLQALKRADRIRPWSAFRDAARASIEAQRSVKGARLRILTETVTSPTLARQLAGVLQQFPDAKWIQYEPATRDGAREGARLAFGEPIDTRYSFGDARVVLAIDADFVSDLPGKLRYVRDFSRHRRPDAADSSMSRLYCVETTPTPTGAIADHRLALRPSEVEAFARAVAAGLGVGVQTEAGVGSQAQWVDAVVHDLKANAGACLVVAGEQQPASVHVLAHAMNHALGNVGKTVVHTDPVEAAPQNQLEALRQLAEEMDKGLVDVLLILGGNPVFAAPADFEFGKRLMKVGLRIYWTLYEDETFDLCHWNVPATHPLETWSDARAYDGTVTILQPLIEPLYEGKSAHELIDALFGTEGEQTSHDIVRASYAKGRDPVEFERFWRLALHDGVVQGTALPPRPTSLTGDWISSLPPAAARDAHVLEIAFRPDPTIFDGRWVNNGWLQELPKPLSKVTWDNVAYIGVRTAERLGIGLSGAGDVNGSGNGSRDIIEIKLQNRAVRLPVWIMPGTADDVVVVHFGYGRRKAGRVGTGVGHDTFALRTSKAPWFESGATVTKTGDTYSIAATQNHFMMEGRNPIRVVSAEEYRAATRADAGST